MISFNRKELGFYSDAPHESPELNFKVYAAKLAETATRQLLDDSSNTILEEAGGALTVGIFGSWGSGKTTLMREIERQIIQQGKRQTQENSKARYKYKSVWFNPWKYDRTEDIQNALIQSILRSIINDQDIQSDSVARKNWMEMAKNFGLCSAGISLRLASAGIQHAINIDTKEMASGIDKEIKTYFKSEDDFDNIDPYLFINQFEEGFRQAVRSYIGDEGRLIIFVDDLDRCLPDNALAVLEAIKLYFDQPNCVFFLGIDKRIIEQAIQQRYGGFESGITGEEYIQKIIRLPFPLPEKDPDSVTKILQVNLNAKYAGNKEFWKLIQDATNSNIRKVKQFVISFHLLESISRDLGLRRSDNSPLTPHLAKLLLIQLNFPILYAEMVKNNDLLRKLESTINEADRDFASVKQQFQKDCDGERIVSNDCLIRFLIDNIDYPANFSRADNFRETMRILSQSGGGR
jgi:hypothetical protein